jgi:hypothetical protein
LIGRIRPWPWIHVPEGGQGRVTLFATLSRSVRDMTGATPTGVHAGRPAGTEPQARENVEKASPNAYPWAYHQTAMEVFVATTTAGEPATVAFGTP